MSLLSFKRLYNTFDENLSRGPYRTIYFNEVTYGRILGIDKNYRNI
jgi:hypothetical protein